MKPLLASVLMSLVLAATSIHAASDADVTIIKGNRIDSITGFGFLYPKGQ